MSMLRVYLYSVGQKVIIPRMVETQDGIFVETHPVQVFDLPDLKAWKKHVYSCLSRGNALVKTPEESTTPGSSILERLNLRRWADFEKNSVMYTIHRAGLIQIYVTGKNKEGMWTTGDRQRTFDGRAPLELVIDEMAADLMREPEAVPKPSTLLLGG
jgi:hypothetical protein